MKIIQLVSAIPGWRVAYKLDGGGYAYDAVACWALVESDDGYQEIQGVVQTGCCMGFAETTLNFDDYYAPGQEAKE